MNTSEHISDSVMRFMADAGWSGAELSPLAGDASSRSYMRAQDSGRKAVLMIAPPAAEAAPCPPDANEEERRALGYNAMARLAGPNLNAFVAISETLRQAGLSAPEIYAADADIGLALIEDLGDDLYARVIGAEDERLLYREAIDVLRALHDAELQPPVNDHYQMLSYDRLALSAEADLLLDWYWPLKKQTSISENLQAEYSSLMGKLLGGLSVPRHIVLRDYHAENLLWLPDRQGIARVGLIDFQDGLYGHAAYDVVSLLEDARRDVADDLAQEMIGHYCTHAGDAFDREAFMRDYAILAVQRNAKILGVFARLAKRDGKPRYLDLLPRVEAHFKKDLARPGMEKIRQFITAHFPDFAS